MHRVVESAELLKCHDESFAARAGAEPEQQPEEEHPADEPRQREAPDHLEELHHDVEDRAARRGEEATASAGLPPGQSPARSAEVLRLDVEDLDLPNRKAK